MAIMLQQTDILQSFHPYKFANFSMESGEAIPDIDDIIRALPLKEKVPIVALKKLLDERIEIEAQQQRDNEGIKLKYQRSIQPLLQRASQIIRGGAIELDEVSWAQDCMKPEEKLSDFLKGKVIESYWVGVFCNSAIVDVINQKDQKALKYLIDIQKVQDPEDAESIELKFIFKPNPFFKETEIRRRLDIKKGQALCVEGDLITWKENQCLTHALKKVTNKKTGEKTTIQGEKIKSFFDIFLNWDKKHPEQLSRVDQIITEVSNLVLDSVDYFLGVINADEVSQDDQGDEESEENEK